MKIVPDSAFDEFLFELNGQSNLQGSEPVMEANSEPSSIETAKSLKDLDDAYSMHVELGTFDPSELDKKYNARLQKWIRHPQVSMRDSVVYLKSMKASGDDTMHLDEATRFAIDEKYLNFGRELAFQQNFERLEKHLNNFKPFTDPESENYLELNQTMDILLFEILRGKLSNGDLHPGSF